MSATKQYIHHIFFSGMEGWEEREDGGRIKGRVGWGVEGTSCDRIGLM